MDNGPQVAAFLFCEAFIAAESNSVYTLSGVYEYVISPSFPYTPESFMVFLSLEGLAAGDRISLMFLLPDGEKLSAVDMNNDITPKGTCSIPMELPEFEFPVPGEYKVRLSVNGNHLATRTLTALETTE